MPTSISFTSNDITNIIYRVGEGAGVLQFKRTHGGRKTAAFFIVHAPGPGIEIAGTLSVATACGIHESFWRKGRCFVESFFCIDNGTAAS